MPKYTYSGDQAALILPTKPRLVLDKGEEVEVSQAEHDKLVKHKIISSLIQSGEIKVEGAKASKAEKTAEEKAAEAAEKKLKAVRDALTKKSIEFGEDETIEQLEEKLKAAG